MLFIGLLIALIFIVLTAVRYKLHPFLSLLGGALIYGFISGMSPLQLVESVNEGFGGLMKNIGLIILIGVMIGTFLERSGGAMALANSILQWLGDKYVTLAMMVSGYVISIPVFADSGFVIMSPLNKALARKAAVPLAGTTAALAIGLLASHVMVPPTPGPIAAAGILNASLTSVLLWGLIVSIMSCLICYLFITKITSKVKISNTDHDEVAEISHNKISPIKSFLPIIIPLILILMASLTRIPSQDALSGGVIQWIQFFGQPVIALLIGLLISFTLPAQWDQSILSSSGWIGDSLKDAAPILLITGAGGIFGKVLQNSGLGEVISSELSISSLGLWLPFFLAAALKTCQGSSTVALVTTASIMAPLLSSMGLDNEWLTTLTVLSIAAGSAVVSHVNDSFFWVLTQMTGFNVKEGYQIQTMTTGVFGISAMMIIYTLYLIM